MDQKKDEQAMIDELVAMLDANMLKGSGHVNVNVTAGASSHTQTMGCSDCSVNPTACSIPTVFFDEDEDNVGGSR
ncbi:MAG: hypothetical protein Q4D52_01265 [Eubacteriales bacterium]|nr:hypothetical protein [Eubacteriales bacterium]